MPVNWASDTVMALTVRYSFELALSSVAWSDGAQLMIFLCFRFSVGLFGSPGFCMSAV